MKKNKKYTFTTRGILTLMFLAASGMSLYLIFFVQGDIFTPVLLSVFSALILANSTIIIYSIQPEFPFKKGPVVNFLDDSYS